METSGTAEFQIDVLDIAEEAFERVGVEMRSGYDLKTARRSLDLLTKEWANRGLNLWTLDEGSVDIEANKTDYTLPDDTIDLIEVVYRPDGQNDRPLRRVSVTHHLTIPNKDQDGQPILFAVHRAVPPVLKIWPTPDDEGSIVYWRLRRIEDTGGSENKMDIPPRFLPAIVSGLAYYLAMKTPQAAEKIPLLQAEYERQYELAANEDRDRSSAHLIPNGCY